MPINFDLEEIRSRFDCKNYFETGLCDPRLNVSCKKALVCNFDRVYSIDLCSEYIRLGKEIFKDHPHLTLINDDSNNIGNYLGSIFFRERTFFFLDAHVDDPKLTGYKNRCPIFNELTAIGKMNRKDHIICVDDLRIFRLENPWEETSYGKIDYIEKIKEMILGINSEYKFTYLDGHEKGDVLMAFI